VTALPDLLPGSHLFVDETKRTGLALIAAIVVAGNVAEVRKAMLAMRLPGQTHIHFTKESPQRRRHLLSAISRLPVQALVYEAGEDDRYFCLQRLLQDAQSIQAARLILERDESLAQHDRRAIYEFTQQNTMRNDFSYGHEGKRDEPILWIADAIAWSWPQRDWKPRVQGLVVGHRDCKPA